jgi:hypothetical protein
LRGCPGNEGARRLIRWTDTISVWTGTSSLGVCSRHSRHVYCPAARLQPAVKLCDQLVKAQRRVKASNSCGHTMASFSPSDGCLQQRGWAPRCLTEDKLKPLLSGQQQQQQGGQDGSQRLVGEIKDNRLHISAAPKPGNSRRLLDQQWLQWSRHRRVAWWQRSSREQ